MAAMDGRRSGEGFVKRAVLLLLLGFLGASTVLRPLRESASAATGFWNDEKLFLRRDDSDEFLFSLEYYRNI